MQASFDEGIGVRAFIGNGWPARAALFPDLASDRVASIKDVVARDFDLGYGFPTGDAVDVYRRAGYHVLGEMPRYVRVLHGGRYLEAQLGPRLSGLAASVIDRSVAVIASVRSHIVRRYQLRWIPAFGPDFDALWRRAGHSHSLICQRDSAFLQWRFLRSATHRSRIAALYSRQGGRLEAYAVVRTGADARVEIQDLFGAGAHELDALVALLVPQLDALGATSLGIRFLGDPSILRLLARHGFSRRTETQPVMIIGGKGLPLFKLRTVDDWYLTDLDEGS